MICPQCGGPIRENENLCWSCGEYIPPPPVPQSPPVPSPYVPVPPPDLPWFKPVRKPFPLRALAIALAALAILGGAAATAIAAYRRGQGPANPPANEQPQGGALTLEAFEALLAALPVTVSDIEADDIEFAGCKIKNNAIEAGIRDFTLGFVAWDADSLPLKAGLLQRDYYVEVERSGANLPAGTAYELNGNAIYNARAIRGDLQRNFESMKIIVVSYTDNEGNAWQNPYLSAWKEAFAGKEYKNNMTIRIGADVNL